MQDWEGSITSGGGVTPNMSELQPLKRRFSMGAQLSVLGVVVLAAGLFVSVVTVQQQQDQRSSAAATNVALNKIATSSSSCAYNEVAAKAVNGSWTGGFYDKWCSTGSTKWMKVDLGSSYSITSFVIRHAGAGGESTNYNTKSFNIQVSSDNLAWTTVVSVANNTSSQTTHTFSPVNARYVKLNVLIPEVVYYSNAARIYEFEVYGSPSTTSSPTFAPIATPTPISSGGSGAVSWINGNANTTINGSILTKTGGVTGSWDAGATSSQQIQSGKVYAEITINDNISNGRMFGLNHYNSSVSYSDIDYAFYFASSGVLQIYENGTLKSSGHTYAVGDVFRIGVENGVVKYYKNSNTMYTSTQTPVYPFFLDASLRDLNSKITTAKLMTTLVATPTSTPIPTIVVPTSTPLPTPTSSIATPTPTNVPTPTSLPSPTPTGILPTATSIPTNVPNPGATLLSLVLALNGIGSTGNTNPLHPQRTVTVDVYNAQNQLVTSKQGLVTYQTSSGKFIGNVDLGTGIVTGAHSVKVKVNQYLRSLVPGIQTIIQGQTSAMPEVSLVSGDINGDNVINIMDYTILMGCYSDLLPPTDCTGNNAALSDLTDDGKTNQFDYNFFLRELSSKSGQ